jgi:hypothetical protein
MNNGDDLIWSCCTQAFLNILIANRVVIASRARRRIIPSRQTSAPSRRDLRGFDWAVLASGAGWMLYFSMIAVRILSFSASAKPRSLPAFDRGEDVSGNR